MDKAPSKKAKIFCWILVITVSVICLLIGFVEMSVYTELKDKCSSEVTGTVIYEGTGRIYDTDKAENKYVSGKYWRQIEVETDGKFKLKNIYAKRGAEKKAIISPFIMTRMILTLIISVIMWAIISRPLYFHLLQAVYCRCFLYS